MNINSGVIQSAHASQRYPYPGSFQGLLNVPLLFIILHGLLLGNVQTENREWMGVRSGWSYRSRRAEKSWPHWIGPGQHLLRSRVQLPQASGLRVLIRKSGFSSVYPELS